jgi:hypothetical protein
LFFPSPLDPSLNESFYSGVKEKSPDSLVINFVKDETDLTVAFKSIVVFNDEPEAMRNNSKFNAKLIIRTWMDPDYTPPNTIAIFDDSPLALLPKISKLRNRKLTETPVQLSSDIHFMFSRIQDLELIPVLSQVLFIRPQ